MTDLIAVSIEQDEKACAIAQDTKDCSVSYADGAFVDLSFLDYSNNISNDNVDCGVGCAKVETSASGEMVSYKPPVYGGFLSPIANYGWGSHFIRHGDNIHVLTNPTIGNNSIWDEYRTVKGADGISMKNPVYTWTLHKRLDMSGWNPPYKSSISNSFSFTSAVYPNVDTYLFYNNFYNLDPYRGYRMLLSKRGDIGGDWSAGVVQWIASSDYDYWNYEYFNLICRPTIDNKYALFALGNKLGAGGNPCVLTAPPEYVLFKLDALNWQYEISAVIACDNVYHILSKGYGWSDIYHVMFIEGYSGGEFTTPEYLWYGYYLPTLIADPASATDVYMWNSQSGYRHLYKKWRGTGEPGVGNWDTSWTDCRADSGYTTKTVSTWAVDQQGRVYAFVFENADPYWHMHCFWLDDDGVWKATYDSVRLCRFLMSDDVIESRTFTSNYSYYPRRNIPYSGYCITTSHDQKKAWMLYGSPQRSVDGSIPPVLYQWDSHYADGNL